jgi:hypothetical protein
MGKKHSIKLTCQQIIWKKTLIKLHATRNVINSSKIACNQKCDKQKIFKFSSHTPHMLALGQYLKSILLSNLVHEMLSFSNSYWDLTKCHYFVDTTERGIMGEREGKDRVTLQTTLLCIV